jgi:hypothetical protein
MSFTIDYNNNTKHHGSLSQSIFKSVRPFVLVIASVLAPERIFRRCSLSLGSSATKHAPNRTSLFRLAGLQLVVDQIDSRPNKIWTDVVTKLFQNIILEKSIR